MRKGVTKPEREYIRYDRLGGNRPGRNICISGRITDAQDERIDDIANEKNITRSKIVFEALTHYLENINNTGGAYNHPPTVVFSNTKEDNVTSTLKRVKT